MAWAVATVVTVGIAWLGIRSVLIAAAPTRTTPLSAAELRGIAPTTPAVTPTPASPSPSPPPAPTAGPPSPTRSPAEAWTQSNNGYKRAFHLVGGDVVAWAGHDDAQILSTNPHQGYQVNVTRYSGDSVMVSFFHDRRTSRVWVRWWNGPYAEVTESVN
jgi:hypothetical protein